VGKETLNCRLQAEKAQLKGVFQAPRLDIDSRALDLHGVEVRLPQNDSPTDDGLKGGKRASPIEHALDHKVHIIGAIWGPMCTAIEGIAQAAADYVQGGLRW